MNACRLLTIAFGLTTALLAGCGSITGLDGTSSYGCKAPEGVKCDSVSGTYYNALQNNLPSQRSKSPSSYKPSQSDGPRAPTAAAMVQASFSPDSSAVDPAMVPLRSAPRFMRLWIKPWEDAEHDLNGESMLYVQIDDGRWLVEHAQQQARAAYQPVRAAKVPTSSAAKPGEPQRPPLANAAPAEESQSITQALRAFQQRGGASASDN